MHQLHIYEENVAFKKGQLMVLYKSLLRMSREEHCSESRPQTRLYLESLSPVWLSPFLREVRALPAPLRQDAWIMLCSAEWERQ